jgi:AbrB family looped-hinge helix DNA binding protein
MEKEITIDASGRVVIPKEARRRLRLTGGSRIIVTVDDDKLTLTPRRDLGGSVEKHGLLVFQGRLDADFPDHRDDRASRLDRLAGRR